MRKKLMLMLIVNLLLLGAFVGYRLYIYIYESDFASVNYENIESIKSLEDGDSFSFAVFGSVQNSIDIFQKRIIPEINDDHNILFCVSTGDAVLDGAEDKYRILNHAIDDLKVPVVIGLGENEVSDGGDRRYYKHFGPFYHSFVFRECYFIFIDTTGTTPYDMQVEWMSGELNKGDQYNHIFIIMNDPLTDDSEIELKDQMFRESLINVFSGHGVTVLSNGSMNFQKSRVGDFDFYSSGGGGGLDIKNSYDADYHYLKIDVNPENVDVNRVVIKLKSGNSAFKILYGIWIYLHSLFYTSFWHIAVVLSLILIFFLVLYIKAVQDVDYYRDFTREHDMTAQKGQLNIAMFTNNYYPFVGGVPISIERLSKALRSRGHFVKIFAPSYPGHEENDLYVYRCGLLHYKKTDKFTYAVANRFSRDMKKEFMKDDYDIVHVHHPFWLGRTGLNLGIRKSIPVVLTYHTRMELYYHNVPIFKKVYKNIISHKWIRRFAQHCDGIISPTESAREYLENIGVSRKKLVMPTGLDFSVYEHESSEMVKAIREEYAGGGEVLLCSVSRLTKEKNLDFLVDGLKLVKEKTEIPFKVIIIGTGSEREHIEETILAYGLDQQVKLTGTVPQDQIVQYYKASDIFVFSSLSETQGMVLTEAMAGFCPVVCLVSSGTDDIIEDGINGFKTRNDLDEWADKLVYLLEKPEERQAMGKRAFESAQNLSMDNMAEKIEDFYRELIDDRS
ncbi:Glycosyltransferase involved in cell wall bisynthesis [Dethiosulfatibacter aminovorans DSM 17477]|uniref:Glycosyltransferase involved in cell wall bisynthesis n=1 Tax=Dethiosulfatibacter aminovorans DSM 17477 TaxID=1121476 RepID=A0A1M6GAZ6_9FIRM|nr:glycosyltransferase [Dethiosulfatibacter aminovorans]SHJ07106.1 Glycosyltransferase involved in cell wall bisynthesis [Dethiosulfatibacter aminovorans DSM 17477]